MRSRFIKVVVWRLLASGSDGWRDAVHRSHNHRKRITDTETIVHGSSPDFATANEGISLLNNIHARPLENVGRSEKNEECRRARDRRGEANRGEGAPLSGYWTFY
jgi:hypothetical protein